MNSDIQLPSSWTTGLFDCFEDPASCLLTCCCPCVTFGRIAEFVDKGSSSCIGSGAMYVLITYLTGFGCLYSCCYRSQMRSQYGMRESDCEDCLVHICCEACALCQEYRELENRGYDLSVGWNANMARQNTATAAPPAVPEGMTK